MDFPAVRGRRGGGGWRRRRLAPRQGIGVRAWVWRRRVCGIGGQNLNQSCQICRSVDSDCRSGRAKCDIGNQCDGRKGDAFQGGVRRFGIDGGGRTQTENIGCSRVINRHQTITGNATRAGGKIKVNTTGSIGVGAQANCFHFHLPRRSCPRHQSIGYPRRT